MTKINKRGFSLIELLVVLLIIGILAAVSAPLFLQNTAKARASEAVAALGSIREAQRTFRSQNGSYITNMGGLTGKDYFGTGGSQQASLGVLIHGNKYFSPQAYTFGAGAGTIGGGGGTAQGTALDFLLTATGSNSVSLATDPTDGARNNGDVAGFIVQMDNSGFTVYSSDNGATWNLY